MRRSLIQAHRTLAAFLLVFIAVHFATHFAATQSIAAQASIRQSASAIYQFPPVEVALVTAFLAQVVLGIRLLRQIAKRKRKDVWHHLQFWSGIYLAIFIVIHTAAAVITRLLIGIDTNFYWAAGTLVLTPLKYGFTPYYILAVSALFTHALAALHYRRPARWHVAALAIGPLVGCIFVAAYGGGLYEVELPRDYLEYFAHYLGPRPGVAI